MFCTKFPGKLSTNNSFCTRLPHPHTYAPTFPLSTVYDDYDDNYDMLVAKGMINSTEKMDFFWCDTKRKRRETEHSEDLVV